MNIHLLQKHTETDSDMKEFRRNLRNHKLRTVLAGLAILCALAAGGWGIWHGIQNRSFESYEVVSSYPRSDAMNTQYMEFQEYVLKYGKDGISCVNQENQLVWSQTYNMQDPMVCVCGGSAALAEKNGTDAMIFDAAGVQGQIQTRLPIQQISVSSQGVLAVLLEDGEVMRLNLYDKKGTELVTSKFELKETGYPMDMSLSADGTKLAVAFLQVQDGGVNTCLAFYNFDAVGENYEDHLVSSQILTGEVVPSLRYVDRTHCLIVGTASLLVYEGEQIPELQQEVPLEQEVASVFYSDHSVGIVTEGEEQKYAISAYDTQGKLEFRQEFDMEYRTLKFSGKNVLIYDEFSCMILNEEGTVLYAGSFEDSVSNLYSLNGHQSYMVMHADRSDRITLR